MGLIGEDGKPLEPQTNESEPKGDPRVEPLAEALLASTFDGYEGKKLADLDEEEQRDVLKLALGILASGDTIKGIIDGPVKGPKVEITVRSDGNLSITGPADPRLVLRMLHEAADVVLMGLTRKAVVESMGAGVQKPNFRDVLAFAKVRP